MYAHALSWLVAVSVMGAIDAAAQSPAFEYADYPAGRGARAIVAADFNRDGWPDVASAAIDTAVVSVLLSAHGDGLAPAITVPVGRGPFDMTTGDFNRDGIPDLAVANADGHSLSMLIGRGDGQFTRSDLSIGIHRGPRGLTTSDLNGDGRLDLVMSAYDSASLAIFFGNGAGAFPTRADFGGAAHPQGVATGDFNRDGRRDIAVVHDGSPGLVVVVRRQRILHACADPGRLGAERRGRGGPQCRWLARRSGRVDGWWPCRDLSRRECGCHLQAIVSGRSRPAGHRHCRCDGRWSGRRRRRQPRLQQRQRAPRRSSARRCVSFTAHVRHRPRRPGSHRR